MINKITTPKLLSARCLDFLSSLTSYCSVLCWFVLAAPVRLLRSQFVNVDMVPALCTTPNPKGQDL